MAELKKAFRFLRRSVRVKSDSLIDGPSHELPKPEAINYCEITNHKALLGILLERFLIQMSVVSLRIPCPRIIVPKKIKQMLR